MKKVLLPLSLLIFISGFSQSINVDSLRFIVKQLKKDTASVKASYELADFYSSRNLLDSALNYYNNGVEISERIKWDLGLEKGLIFLGITLGESGNYPKALEILFRALRISEKNKRPKQFFIYATIGTLYNKAGDYKEAIFYHGKAIKFRDSLGLEKEPGFYSNLAENLLLEKQIDSALKYQGIAFALALQKKQERWITYSMCNFGNIYLALNKPEVAKHSYSSALATPYLQEDENYDIFSLKSDIFFGLVKSYQKLGVEDSSSFYARADIDIANRIRNYSRVVEAAVFLRDIYEKKGVSDSILKYQSIIIVNKDSAYNLEKFKKIQQIKIAEAYYQLQTAKKLQKDKEERRRNIQLSLIAFFIPVFIAFVYLLSKKRKKRDRVILLLGIASLLMLFEFISLLIHPSVEKVTDHNAIFMYLVLLIIASILVPLHHRLEKFIKSKL